MTQDVGEKKSSFLNKGKPLFILSGMVGLAILGALSASCMTDMYYGNVVDIVFSQAVQTRSEGQIMDLQHRINAFLPKNKQIQEDGLFGPETRRAVNNLSPDQFAKIQKEWDSRSDYEIQKEDELKKEEKEREEERKRYKEAEEKYQREQEEKLKNWEALQNELRTVRVTKSNEIMILQNRINRYTKNKIVADGFMGDKTRAALLSLSSDELKQIHLGFIPRGMTWKQGVTAFQNVLNDYLPVKDRIKTDGKWGSETSSALLKLDSTDLFCFYGSWVWKLKSTSRPIPMRGEERVW